jgi:LysM repeat protein/ABC-type branched-subunit amino acid transport system substrate-binding protein
VRTLLLLLLLLCTFTVLTAQEKESGQRITENGKTFILYKVQAKETLYSIGRKFNVGLQLLTEINPQVANGLKSGEVLKIPVVEENISVLPEPSDHKPVRFLSHKVQRKETLYFISRKYGVSVDDILQYNQGMTQLKKGETIRIPQWTTSDYKDERDVVDIQEKDGDITHIVKPGETLYSISRKYGKSVSAMLEQNPEAGNLKPGMRLTIPSGQSDIRKMAAVPGELQEHIVREGESLYSLSIQYDVSADRLIEINPALKKGCKTGMVIKIPVDTGKSVKNEPSGAKSGSVHIVSGGETLYGISQNYQIALSDIIRDNPFLENRPLRVGDSLYIAVRKKTIPENNKDIKGEKPGNINKRECEPNSVSPKETFKVAMLIPLMVGSNKSLNEELLQNQYKQENGITDDSDTIKTSGRLSSMIQFQGNSENYIHLYEGVLLAIDSLQQMGINLELNVWDTEQKSSKTKSIVSSGVLREADLIIGPVYPNEQKEISDYAEKNKIPIVSPLSPSDEYTKDNPFFFQVNPTKEYIAERTSEYVISAYRNSNIVVIQTSSSGNEAENELSRLKNIAEESKNNNHTTTISICNFRKDGYAGLKEQMVKERKNVIMVPSANEAEVSVVVSNMKTLSSEYDIILIGNSRFPQFESIKPEQYHQGQLEFLTPYWPDMSSPVTSSFVNKFRNYFRADPNQYSMQGYDVTFFFVKALSDFGPDFRNCISSEKAQLVQGTYHFSRLTSGGYLNNGLSVIQYLPSFEMVRKKVITD